MTSHVFLRGGVTILQEDTQLSSLCTPTWLQSSHFGIIHILLLLFGIDFLLTLANCKINLSAVLSCSGKVWYATVVGIFDRHCKIPTLLILSPVPAKQTVHCPKLLQFPWNHPRERIQQVLKHTVLKEILQSARKYSFICYENITCKELSR